MGRKMLFMVLLVGVLALSLAMPSIARAHEPHECPKDYPDVPMLSGHVQQSQITSGALSFDEIVAAGKILFDAAFNHCDAQGRPATTGTGNARQPGQPAFTRVSAPDSNACAGCHNQPRSGGGGDFVANVFVLGQALDPVSDSIEAQFSNERNTLGMFGAGPIEMLAREMTADLLAIRDEAVAQAAAQNTPVTLPLQAKGVSFGHITAQADGTLDSSAVEGVDPDLIIKPFHQAGVVISLRQFSNNAMNHHHGMQSEERFDLVPAKGPDFDQDGFTNELTIGDITAVSLYQASLGVPGQLLPKDRQGKADIAQGEQVFTQVGCTGCHVPELTLESRFFSEPNPYNPAGNFSDQSQSYAYDMTSQGEGPYLERAGEGAVVRAFTDLKRHDLCDPASHPDPIRFYCNEQLAQDRPDQAGLPGTEFFITRKLWDVGNSSPYGHRGDLTTITEAIMYHGGEARQARDAFAALPYADQQALVKFLYSLQVLPAGSPRVMTAGQTPLAVETQVLIAAAALLVLGTLLNYVLWRRRQQQPLSPGPAPVEVPAGD